MFIKNQSFKDEETLLDAMFDFNIGTTSPYVQEEVKKIDKDLETSEQYQEFKASLEDEDDKAELYMEERDLRLAEVFMKRFDSFMIDRAQLFGLEGTERVLLYEIDMV